MSGIYTGKETKSAAKYCPKCGGSSIEEKAHGLIDSRTGMVSTKAKCAACDWSGPPNELVARPFTHEMGSDEQILHSMVTDLRNVLAKEFAKSFGAFLRKWGFISAGVTPVELSKYIVAVAKATMTAILETRQEIEKQEKGS